ncbi:MAG: hypothetical protein LIR46_08110 [Bacteroidota bacterium]|nr:hypothetical protein [Bacteroidota bacterium]
MELVIKISKKDYETLINKNDSTTPSMIARMNLYKALKNGTPLPKGHGDLKDIDAINIDEEDFYEGADYVRAIEAIIDAPTIIEADK